METHKADLKHFDNLQAEVKVLTAGQKRLGLLSGKKVEIPDVRYQSDLELHDRYQAFSEQITRLSLGGIAVIGFLVTLLVKDGGGVVVQMKKSVSVPRLFLASTMLFGIAAGLALAHKYLASDGLYYHFRAIKYLILKEENKFPALNEKLEERATQDECKRNWRFELSGRFLWAGAFTLVLGAFAAALAFAAVLKQL